MKDHTEIVICPCRRWHAVKVSHRAKNGRVHLRCGLTMKTRANGKEGSIDFIFRRKPVLISDMCTGQSKLLIVLEKPQ